MVDERTVDGLGRITTSVLDPDADLDTVHAWVTARGTEFWGLGELSREELRDTYAFVDSLPTHHAYLAALRRRARGAAPGLRPRGRPAGRVLRGAAGDVGLHLLVGARVRPGVLDAGCSARSSRSCALRGRVSSPSRTSQRQRPRAHDPQRLRRRPVIELPHKRAQLASSPCELAHEQHHRDARPERAGARERRRTERVTPHMVRVTLTGDDLRRFEYRGFDQWFRLAVPVDDHAGSTTCPDSSTPAPTCATWCCRSRRGR